MEVLAGMDFVAEIAARGAKGVKDWQPALRQFVEGRFDQSRRPLWPRINVRPGERAGSSRWGLEAESARLLGGMFHSLARPGPPRLALAAHQRIGKSVECDVIGRM